MIKILLLVIISILNMNSIEKKNIIKKVKTNRISIENTFIKQDLYIGDFNYDSFDKLDKSNDLLKKVFNFIDDIISNENKSSILSAVKAYNYVKKQIKEYDEFEKKLNELERFSINFKTDFRSLIKFYNIEQQYDSSKNKLVSNINLKNHLNEINLKYNNHFRVLTNEFNKNMGVIINLFLNGQNSYKLIKETYEESLKKEKDITLFILSAALGANIIKEFTNIVKKYKNLNSISSKIKTKLLEEFKKYENGIKIALFCLFYYLYI